MYLKLLIFMVSRVLDCGSLSKLLSNGKVQTIEEHGTTRNLNYKSLRSRYLISDFVDILLLGGF